MQRFGPFRLDSDDRLLLRDGQSIPLAPKVFDLLVYLVSHAGHLVTKQELMSSLWPATFVEEANLSYTVSALRKALGDGQNGERFIETVPTRGYRFVAPVTTEEASGSPSAATTVPGRQRRPARRVMVGVLLAVAVLATTIAAVRALREPDRELATATFTIPLPDTNLATYSIPVPQISPDGSRLALLVAPGARVWLRDLEDPEQTARPLAGTEGTRALFWAPDNQHLGFITSSAVKTLRLSDGAVHNLCDTCQPAGAGTWSRSGRIIFPSLNGSLMVIPAGGGSADALTTLNSAAGERAHRAPSFLPDGLHFLYVIRNADPSRSGLHVGHVDFADRRLLMSGDLPAVFAAPRYLLFPQSGAVMAREFDLARLEFSGAAYPVVRAEFLRNELGGQPAFSASDTGVLSYGIVEKPLGQFQWFGRDGTPQELVGEPARYYTFDLSSDGRRLVYARSEAGNNLLWVRDLARDIESRLTIGPGSHSDPRWVDGRDVVATRWQPLPPAIVRIGPDGHESIILSRRQATMVDDVASDGRHMLYREPVGRLMVMPLADGAKALSVRTAPSGSLNQGTISPDNGWIAYQEEDESGHVEVFVTAFPPAPERWQVSAGGGVQPIWRADSRELYYLDLDGTLRAVTLRTGAQPRFSAPAPLFRAGLRPPARTIEEYAVSNDGKRFLLLKPVEDRVQSSVGVILNWRVLLTSANRNGRRDAR